MSKRVWKYFSIAILATFALLVPMTFIPADVQWVPKAFAIVGTVIVVVALAFAGAAVGKRVMGKGE